MQKVLNGFRPCSFANHSDLLKVRYDFKAGGPRGLGFMVYVPSDLVDKSVHTVRGQHTVLKRAQWVRICSHIEHGTVKRVELKVLQIQFRSLFHKPVVEHLQFFKLQKLTHAVPLPDLRKLMMVGES